MTDTVQALSAILPCNDIDASEAFYARLGIRRQGRAGISARTVAGLLCARSRLKAGMTASF